MFRFFLALLFALSIPFAHADPEDDAERIRHQARILKGIALRQNTVHKTLLSGTLSEEERRALSKETWDFSNEVQECLKGTVTYETDPERFHGLYCDASHLAGGGHCRVLSAKLLQTRDGAERETPVALRLAKNYPLSQEVTSFCTEGLVELALLSTLSEITLYFPKFYGCVIGPDFHSIAYMQGNERPPEGVNTFTWDWNEERANHRYLYQEMTLADGTWEGVDEFTPSQVFEHLLGEWAALRILGVSLGDIKYRNHGFKSIDDNRYYVVGDHIYCMPEKDAMPMRLDIDLADRKSPKMFTGLHMHDGGLPENLRGLGMRLNSGTNLFDLFSELFSEFLVPEIPADANPAYIFHIPAEAIDEEYALTDAFVASSST